MNQGTHHEHQHKNCENHYLPKLAVIQEVIQETRNIRRYLLQYVEEKDRNAPEPEGEFYEITVFGAGEIAISCPDHRKPGEPFEFCVKKAGKVTGAMFQMKEGDLVGLRGPFGRGFPYEDFAGHDVIIVGSGVGLAPVRPMILDIMRHREEFGKVVIIGSALTYEDLIYRDDMVEWAKVPSVQMKYALSHPTDKVDAHVGYINDLLPDLDLNWKETRAIVCASPRRIKAVAKDLLKLGMQEVDIYTSLETHMRCGIGKCGHCKVGSKYMCIDGPVFTYQEMLSLPQEF